MRTKALGVVEDVGDVGDVEAVEEFPGNFRRLSKEDQQVNE